ncbi:MAG: vanadium-dependent haloperoxidase [Polyangia bacterium]
MKALALSLLVGLCACEGAPPTWSAVTPAPLAEALLSVGGTSASDVWAVGSDKGSGPIVLHFDGSTWSRIATNTRGTLWWVHAFADGTVYAAGAGATILRWDGTAFSRMTTPGLAAATVFGVWGRSPYDAYAVGSVSGRDGFVWHWDGTTWAVVDVPHDLRGDTSEAPGFFKVAGDATHVFVVGAHGNLLQRDGDGPFSPIATATTDTLYTVATDGDHHAEVGGGATGVLIDDARTSTPVDAGLLQGLAFGPGGAAIATGADGAIYERSSSGWARQHTGLAMNIESLHAAWIDPDGGQWAVGGNVLSSSLDGGVLLHRGATIAGYAEVLPDMGPPSTACPEDQIDPQPERSIARRWDEQILGAIRRDVPRPTVHARNLFHVSAAMWDAWATYDTVADGVFFHERHVGAQVDREQALSYAAYRLLQHRYTGQVGGAVSNACFDAFFARLGYDATITTPDGDAPAAIGNRIAATIIAATVDDGANEANNYADETGFVAANPPLFIDLPGTTMTAPDEWQPLNLAVAETQNGLLVSSGVQSYVGSNWDRVTPFSLSRPSSDVAYFDTGLTPTAAQPEMKDWLVDVLSKQAWLDASDGVTVDLSPGTLGNDTLGTNDGHGRALNPITGAPYVAQPALRGDFGRVLAEFWADGPSSETPPGHWNVIANQVTDSAGFARRLGGTGASLEPLEWDVKVYLALNGAVHDAAITSWGTKRRTTTARPISLIRYMAGLGQSSDPSLPHYDVNGLPLVSGLIELITPQSCAPGQRHARLARHTGELAIFAWRGEPGDRVHQTAGIGWVRALEWLPYQRRTFVTPAFPGFTSGHSTFSRAAAEVLTTLTGSEYFPGGLGQYIAKQGSLKFEEGPTADVHLQWATYYDAADQAGQSRLWGGIHLASDDFIGRITGSLAGKAATALAMKFFAGTALP